MSASTIERIKKLLQIAKTSHSTNEAAIALKRAQHLMGEMGLTELDVEEDAIVEEEFTRKRWVLNIYRVNLVSLMELCFGVKALSSKLSGGHMISFVGPQAQVTIALYAYEVLLRQLERDLRKHIARVKLQKNRRARGDVFGAAWVAGVRAQMMAFGGRDRSKDIAAYVAKRYGELAKTKIQARTSGVAKQSDYAAGRHAGAAAKLHRGVDGKEERLALPGAA